MKQHVLIDMMDTGVNELRCSCGVQLSPDCDVSLFSIVECFEEHLREVGDPDGTITES